ncbi:MAG TPA: hypothetical protein VH601_18615 [Bryobacteraceae bacterium]
MTVPDEHEITEAERNDLAARAAHIGKEASDLIRDPKSRVTKLPTPFFHDGAVYQVTSNMPARPVVFTIGAAGRDFATMLAQNPSGFFQLGTNAGLSIGSPELRLQYAQVFLEATRDFRQRLQILKSASDIELVPSATQEEKAHHTALLDKYESTIRPPHVSPIVPSEVVVYAIVGQDLHEMRLKISNDGTIARSDTVLEKDLPVAVAR